MEIFWNEIETSSLDIPYADFPDSAALALRRTRPVTAPSAKKFLRKNRFLINAHEIACSKRFPEAFGIS